MEQEQLKDILKPHAHDVLSGRGNFVNHHSGNENFRKLVKHHKKAYVACPKAQKAIYSKIIYDEIRAMNPPGRFLKQDPKTKLWGDIGEKKALDKTRQALREGAPELLKELETTVMGGDDNGGEDFVAPLRTQRNVLAESLMGNASVGSFSMGSFTLGQSFNTQGTLGQSFNTQGTLGQSFSTAGTGNTMSSFTGIPPQVGFDGNTSLGSINNSMTFGGGGMGDQMATNNILAAAAQLQQQQQHQQQQQQLRNSNTSVPAEWETQLQMLKQQMQMNSQTANNAAAAQQFQQNQGGGNNMNNSGGNVNNNGLGNNQNLNMLNNNNNGGNNNNGMPGMGSNEMTALLAAIHNSASGLNNASGAGGPMGNVVASNAAYQQQLAQLAMFNQMNGMNGLNNSGMNNAGNESDSTLATGNLQNEMTQMHNNVNNGSNFGGGANNITSSFGSIASQQTQQHQNTGFGGDQYQEQSFNISVPLKPSSEDTIESPSPMKGDSNITSPDQGQQQNRRRPGGMRNQGGGGLNSSLNTSFTRAQRIGLKNSFTRRPNRRMNNAELQSSLKNSLMSIESLTLDDLGSMEGVFDSQSESTTKPGGGGECGDEKKNHGDGPHDMSEVSELEFEEKV